jgi:hypothetical protein
MAAISGIFLSNNWVFEFFGSRPRPELVKKITGFYSHKEDAAIIGVEYLNSALEEVDMHKIINLILSDSDKYRQLADANSDEAHALIVGWQREDFEHGRIVNVSGWLLSETEARVCALTALIRDSGGISKTSILPHEQRGGSGCLKRFSASKSGASAGVRLPSGGAAV